MYQGTIEFVLNDFWVKRLLKYYDSEKLVDLIEDRVKWSMTGPFCPAVEGRLDIIDKLIEVREPDFRHKIESAVGLAIWKILHHKSEEKFDVLSALFSLIKNSRLTRCYTLVKHWLQARAELLNRTNNYDTNLYAAGMLAFAYIQHPEPEIEKFWLDVWTSNRPHFWRPAYIGLYLQNPDTACKELPVFWSREVSDKYGLLVDLWKENPQPIANALSLGLNNDCGFAGQLANNLGKLLKESDRIELLKQIKASSSVNSVAA